MIRFIMHHGIEGEYPKPGEWVRNDMAYPGRTADLQRVGVKAICCCPKGHQGSLVSHTIDESGEVSASYLCHRKDCGFHEWVMLEGWSSDHA